MNTRCQDTVAECSLENLLLLQVVENDLGGFSFQTPVFDNNAGAADNLSSFSLFVNLAESSPLSKFLVVINLHQGNVMFLAESWNKLLVHGFTAVVSQHAEQSLTPNKSQHDISACITYHISFPYLSKALAASWRPRARPSWIMAFFKTSWVASLMSMGPPTAGTSPLQVK